ncbi:hypothetical protein [Microbacterium indicum]|uniref:hypothetical protein n=1 Tax=Microbacterium indicum TaxID=358100 RepID=UPI00048B7DF7|nr:hypothetical protein [Microbacterium indicum]
MTLETLLRRVDRLAGGSLRDIRVPRVADPRAALALRWVAWIFVGCLALGVATITIALVLTVEGSAPSLVVWMRCLVLFAITASLFYFLWRAQLGWYWAFRRLQLFTRIFPVVAIVLALIPGLFPVWVIAEQLLFGVLLIAAQVLLVSRPVREAFPKPQPASA